MASGTDVAPIFGQVTGLMLQSAAHKHLLLSDLEWLVLPALLHGQYRLFRQDGVAVAYASWAYASEEVGQSLQSNQPRLRPAEWRSGEVPWLVDLVAPHGGADKVLSELRSTVFVDKVLHVSGTP